MIVNEARADVEKKVSGAKTKAWMLNQTGHVFNVIAHPYGYRDGDIEDNVSAASFLRIANKTSSTVDKSIIDHVMLTFLSGLIYNAIEEFEDYEEYSLEELAIAYYKMMDYDSEAALFKPDNIKDVVKDYIGKFKTIKDAIKYYEANKDYTGSNIVDILNQKYLRVRQGGQYDSKSGSEDEIWFRISSTGFNWFTLIRGFLKTNCKDAKYITVVRDQESTGKFFYYETKNKVEIKKMLISDFMDNVEFEGTILENKMGVVIESNYINERGIRGLIKEAFARGYDIHEIKENYKLDDDLLLEVKRYYTKRDLAIDYRPRYCVNPNKRIKLK